MTLCRTGFFSRDEFTISCPTVKGNIEKIRIGQDNSGTMPGWYLDWVRQ